MVDFATLHDKLGIKPGSGVVIYVVEDPKTRVRAFRDAVAASREDGRNAVLTGPLDPGIENAAEVIIDHQGRVIKNRRGPIGGSIL